VLHSVTRYLALALGMCVLPLWAAPALTNQNDMVTNQQPGYARRDLPALQKMQRRQVFAALRSFDEKGLAEPDFSWQALELLDPARVPGLAEARQAGDLPGALAAVFAACSRQPVGAPAALTEDARAQADAALSNRFSFYGETRQLPAKIDWDFNPGTDHWGHDLNRFGYLAPLVQAYVATGDARYSRKAAGLVLDWIDQCDFARVFKGGGYAFGSYLNQAYQARQWGVTASQLAARRQISPPELLRILKSLHDHLAYLELVTDGHEGNWPTIGCMGMLAGLERLPVLRDTGRFADYCRKTLALQTAVQVLPDGVQDELTPHYHKVVVGNLLASRASLRALGMDLAPATLQTLRKMTHYCQQTTLPDGSRQVAFNDSDPRSVFKPDQLKTQGLADYITPAAKLGPEGFPYAGVALLRQRQDQGDLYLAFDAGPYGRAHQHEDKLGFWLFAYGRSFLVDPGRHLYDFSAVSYLPHLRSTRAHSTIMVDGQGQNSAGRPGTWIAKAPLDLGWRAAPGEVRAAGVYDLGYGPQNAIAVVHRREIVFVRERCWVIFDLVTGKGAHQVEARFQFAPGPVRLEGTRACTAFPDANLLLWPLGDRPVAGARLEEGQAQPRAGWYSDSYNQIEPAPSLVLSMPGQLPLRLATLLFPYRGEKQPKLEFTCDGRAAIIKHADFGEVRVESSLP
jgi:hypothetical protein